MLSLCGAGALQAADSYPKKPILVIVPYPAGGVLDAQVRLLGQQLAAQLGQSIVVEARPGASGNIAAEHVIRAAPDGYTLLATTTFVASNPIVDPATRWAAKDLIPVSAFSETHSYLLVPASSPAKTVKEFVELAKRAPKPFHVADGGPGTSITMAIELFKKAAGIQLDAVPYKGAPPALLDLANGLLDASILPASVAYPQVVAGKLRALATIGRARSPQLSDVPTFAEAGFPQAETLTWFGLHAPAATSAEIVQRLDAAVEQAVQSDEVAARIRSMGGSVNYLNTAQFTDLLASERRRWDALVPTKR